MADKGKNEDISYMWNNPTENFLEGIWSMLFGGASKPKKTAEPGSTKPSILGNLLPLSKDAQALEYFKKVQEGTANGYSPSKEMELQKHYVAMRKGEYGQPQTVDELSSMKFKKIEEIRSKEVKSHLNAQRWLDENK